MISLLLPDLRGGGAERVMIDLARAFVALGHSVEFVLMQALGEYLPEVKREFKIVDLATPRARNAPGALARYLRRRRPDAMIANMWPLTSAAVAGRTLSRHRCRLLLVEHSTLSRQYAAWGRSHMLMLQISLTLTHRFADLVAAVSAGSAVDLARLARLRSDQVKILYNPIPQKPMPRPNLLAIADALWGCPRGERILTVGNLKDQKNHALLLRAFANMHRPNARLMLLGRGPNEDAMRTLAFELGIADRLIFAGFHADPTPFYATADLFALSSDYEGLPTVLIEALSFGLPVVSTDCPSGPAEILEGGRWGKLIPVGDAEALAAAIDCALDTPHDPAALRRRAADFAPEIAARKYLDLLGLA